jgi:hypothetical protein
MAPSDLEVENVDGEFLTCRGRISALCIHMVEYQFEIF